MDADAALLDTALSRPPGPPAVPLLPDRFPAAAAAEAQQQLLAERNAGRLPASTTILLRPRAAAQLDVASRSPPNVCQLMEAGHRASRLRDVLIEPGP